MRLKLKDLRSVNFHDSKLLKIEEQSCYIRMDIDVGLIWLPLNEATNSAWVVHECTLECFGVTSSEKRQWLDSRTKRWTDMRLAIPSSNLGVPINELSHVEVKDSYLELGGFTRDKNWAAWRITAQHYEFNWKTQKAFEQN